MKMKKIVCSLMISVLCFMTAISGVSAANTYDTNKLLDAADKVKAFYKENGLSDTNYLDDIIAYEALGGEAENDLDISKFESKISDKCENLFSGDISKIIIASQLIKKDPRKLIVNGTEYDLVDTLEKRVQNDGKIEGNNGSNYDIWVLLALESVSSSKVDIVADNLSRENIYPDVNGIYGGFWYYGPYVNLDITGWGIEALSIANKEKYKDSITAAINYLENYKQQDASYNQKSSEYDEANADTQACAVEALSVYNRESLLNGEYDKNNKNPIDVLLSFQNGKGYFGWKSSSEDYNSYATQDAARAIGTIVNGSVIYKAKGIKSPDATLTRVENKPSTNPTQPTDNRQDNKENKTNKKTTSVKTGDETNVVIFALLSMVSGGLFLVLRKEYERVH